MASLLVLQGANAGQRLPLTTERITFGRNPDCNIVIPVTSVSREHAHILRVQGKYYIEDMQSRNGTFVNNQPVSTRTLLKPNDRIRICDFLASFHDTLLPSFADEVEDEGENEEGDGSNTVEAVLTHHQGILSTHPADKLKTLLEISSNLSKTLELDRLLPKIVDSLFLMFKQADRCFIILTQEGTGKLLPKVIKTRRPQDESTARFSRSIVKQCLDSKQLFLSNNASEDKRILSQSVVDFRIRSVMCAPLCTTEGKAFGVIQLDTQDRSKKFTEDDLNLLMGVANQASIAMENTRLYRDIQVRAQVERDLQLAHQVQRSFLPSQLPELAGYEFFAYYESASEVGGDYYGFVPMGGRRLAITLGDVAGKGVAAALLMAKLAADVRFCLLSEAGLAQAVNHLNNLVYQNASQMDRFITLVAVLLDVEEHGLTLVNAGHLTPLLYRAATGALEEATDKGSAGLPLGIIEEQNYSSAFISLEPGDCLLLFSDGVPDAVNVRNVPFGIKGIQAAVQPSERPYSPHTRGERIVKAVKQHVAGHSQNDDITLVCIGRN